MEKEIGYVEHFFDHISVAGIKVTAGPIKIGDTLHIKGHTSDVKLTIESMQIDNAEVEGAKTGDDIGIVVPEKVRVHDKVYLKTE